MSCPKLWLEGYSSEWLLGIVLILCAGAQAALDNSAHIKGQLRVYEAAALYALATRYNKVGVNILEIGTAEGYSASLIAQATPKAKVVTLNPSAGEVKSARANLKMWSNVEVMQVASWDLLQIYEGPNLDFIFVDGNHKEVRQDLPWWDWVSNEGLMLFHDYGRFRGRRDLFDAVNDFFDRSPDVYIENWQGFGMGGFYK